MKKLVLIAIPAILAVIVFVPISNRVLYWSLFAVIFVLVYLFHIMEDVVPMKDIAASLGTSDFFSLKCGYVKINGQKAELKVRASILGIQDKVTFVGNIPNDQVKDYLNAADLFLFASRSETQGIVLVEALAAGCPVVAVHATGADDVVRNGVNGFLTAEDEDAWAEKAAEALRPENLGRMREAARSDADNYRASRLAIYAEMLYNQCVLRKGENGYERSEDRGGHVAAAVRKVS